MKRIFTFLVVFFVVTLAMAQDAPTGVFAKASVAPVIDGVIDDVWTEATVYNIDQPYKTEVPTLGNSGETTWQALWNTEGVYVLLKVTDDAFFPSYMATPPSGDNWKYDKPELYFNVNAELKNGLGGNSPGHYQVAPGFTDGKNDGTPITTIEGVIGVVYAFNVTGPNYIAEYFIPFSKLINSERFQVDLINPIGFDVTIIDSDPTGTMRQRAVWANVGAKDESNNNMDDLGTVTFEGAEAAITIDKITLNTGGTITTDNGTLQMVSTITPADATNKVLNWTVVNLTGKATVDSKGLVKAIKDGTVSVKATSTDEMGAEAIVDVVITGQVVTSLESTYVVDGIFATDGAPLSVWVSENLVSSTIVNGIAEIVPKAVKAAPDTPAPWDNKFRQTLNVPFDLKDTEMIFTFKAWADADRILTVDFEDSKNNYPRYGVSPNGIEGKSDWLINLTTEPTVFTFDVTFSAMLENAVQEMVFMGGMAEAKYYIDNVMLMTKVDFALPNAKSFNANSLKLYPNPIDGNNQLTVELASANVKVAIYNALGQKMMEKVSTGNVVKFDVNSLTKGLYFVRLADGSTQKFIK